jgi:translation initiation factor 4G
MEKSSLQPSSERPVGGAHCDAKRQVAGSAATGTGAAGVGGSAALGTPSSQSGVGARTSGYAAIVSRGSATGGGGAVASHPSGTTPVDSGAPGGNGAAVQHKISIEPEGPTAATAVGRSTAGVPAGGGGAAQTFAPVDGRMPVNPGTMSPWSSNIALATNSTNWGGAIPAAVAGADATSGRGGNAAAYGGGMVRAPPPSTVGSIARPGPAAHHGRSPYAGASSRPSASTRGAPAAAFARDGTSSAYGPNVVYGGGSGSGGISHMGAMGMTSFSGATAYMNPNEMAAYMPDMQQAAGFNMYVPPQYYGGLRNPMIGGTEYIPYGMPFNPAANAAAFYRQQYQQQARAPMNTGVATSSDRSVSPLAGNSSNTNGEIDVQTATVAAPPSGSVRSNAHASSVATRAAGSTTSSPSSSGEVAPDAMGILPNLGITGEGTVLMPAGGERNVTGFQGFASSAAPMNREVDRPLVPPIPPRREKKILKIVDPETGKEINLGSVQEELATATGHGQPAKAPDAKAPAAETSEEERAPQVPANSAAVETRGSEASQIEVEDGLARGPDAASSGIRKQAVEHGLPATPLPESESLDRPNEKESLGATRPELKEFRSAAVRAQFDSANFAVHSETRDRFDVRVEHDSASAAGLLQPEDTSTGMVSDAGDVKSVVSAESAKVDVSTQNGYVESPYREVSPAIAVQDTLEPSSTRVAETELVAMTKALADVRIETQEDRTEASEQQKAPSTAEPSAMDTVHAEARTAATAQRDKPSEPTEEADMDSSPLEMTPHESDREDILSTVDTEPVPDDASESSSLVDDEETTHPGVLVFGPGERRMYPREWLLRMRDICVECPPEVHQCEIRAGASFESVQQRRSGGGGGGGRARHGTGGTASSRGAPGAGKGDGMDLANARARAPPVASTGGESDRRGHRGGGGRGNRRGANAAVIEEALALLPRAENAWRPRKVPESEVERKVRTVRSILNKLTLEKFEPLYQQLLSINIDSLEVLRGVVKEIFEKALLEPNFGAMYAELCARLAVDLEKVIEGNEAFIEDGKLQTFKRILLRYCQREFEGNSSPVIPEGASPEEAQEIATKAKLRMLGNMVFIGHLYRNKLLSDKVIHASCFATLLKLSNQPQPDEDAIECMCKLMTTVGEKLDNSNPKSRELMREYFAKFVEMSQRPDLPARFRFMLQDLIDLRNNRWVQRRSDGGARTIREIHEQVRREQLQQQQLKRRPSGLLLSGPSGRRIPGSAGNGPGSTSLGGGGASAHAQTPSPRMMTPVMSNDARRERSSSALQPGWERVQRAVPETKEAARALDLGTVRLRPHGGRRSPAPSAASTPSLGTPRNSFAALQDEQMPLSPEPTSGTDEVDSEQPAAGIAERSERSSAHPSATQADEMEKIPEWEPNRVERRAKTIYDEWMALRDVKEARLALAEVPPRSRAALVANIVQRSLDLSGEQREHLLRLFTETVHARLVPLDDIATAEPVANDTRSGADASARVAPDQQTPLPGEHSDTSLVRPLEPMHLRRATTLILADLEDLVIDHPRALSFLAHWLAHCLVQTTVAADTQEQRAQPQGAGVSLWGRPVTARDAAAALRELLLPVVDSWLANGSDLALPLVAHTADALRTRSPLFTDDQLAAFLRALALPWAAWATAATGASGASATDQDVSRHIRAEFARVGLETVWSNVASAAAAD